ncbi:MAG: beta-glucosidase BglX [Dysgonamonadaceae bacterium]|jgi:beta-glucosidase|nr:beta-glucosidase BglX [Dysgonamonadaceae bacterium]
MKRILIVLIAAACLTACTKKPSKEADMDKFITDLMRQMTLEERIGQMNLLTMWFDVTGPRMSKGVEKKVRDGLVGGVFNFWTPNAVRKLQDTILTQTRLKIPLLVGYDVIHGHRTIYPIPLALASTWDMELIEQIATAVADEASADGLHWTFSPMVDIVRDPRWGRVSDTAGEDTFLGSEIAKAMVRGYEQGDLSKQNTIMSCVKHFALYGAAEGGRDYNTVDMSRIRMYNEYLPPYEAAVRAGASSIMTSFNEIDGVPATGNRWLLTDLLREQWGFDGFVVADYTSVSEMENHGSGDKAKVTEMSINAGLDMDMVSEYMIEELPALVRAGRVKESTVNAACRRILEAKYKLGLFTDPYRGVSDERAKSQIMSEDKLALSKEAALKSIVLLKNNRKTLPLDASKKIAFIGPLVKNQRTLLGSSAAAGNWKQVKTLWDALESKYANNKFLYAQGSHLVENKLIQRMTDQQNGNVIDDRPAKQLIAEAVQTAEKADIIVAVLGEAYDMSGEAASMSNIGLLDNQKALLKALKDTGKPIVLVLMNGRPMTLQWENDNIDAILETWHTGTRGGEAIVDILFGDANPSGKITMTFPRSAGQIPIYYNHKNSGRPFSNDSKFTVKYIDIDNSPLYPFGYGLSYTQFEYSDVQLSDSTLTGKGAVTATVTITNTGDRTGEEIVQLYIRDLVGSITRPVKELKGFQKITLNAGESREVTFHITPEALKFYNTDLKWISEPGDFLIFIGGNSETNNRAKLTLI